MKNRHALLDSGSQNKPTVSCTSEILIASDALGEGTRVGSLRYPEGTTEQQDQLEWQGCDSWLSRQQNSFSYNYL
ncbi:hypothetical protein BDV41DRAFT_583569 [Aspergillus transmontanensis]|uniref:Uncharacterized protein n=1 Tax=Aspergillus transmontanensis TaxID=1034304 RepID=A0A5N6VCF4_9EURO|nr:hypothetical protein BDV41DRAFT_583569 [Aspergillus transmontanensis]